MGAGLKKILRFYYSAESLNERLDSLISATASLSWKSGGTALADFSRVEKLVEVKGELSEFYARLCGVMSGMSESDLRTLKSYSSMRTGTGKLSAEAKSEIHRAAVKFARRASGVISSCPQAIKCVKAYYALTF